MNHRHIAVNGIHLHCVDAGDGPLVVLLHGFPEFWYGWRHQLPALAHAGFRCRAPDLRGYNTSDRPAGVSRYRVRELVEDVAALIREAGGPAFVVGHDWGGVIAWRFAALHPELVRKLVVLNAPHPLGYRDALRRAPGQWLRSWYVALFQVPGVAEWLLQAGDFALLTRTWRRQPTRPGAFKAEDLAAYKRALGAPGGLTGPLNYYRAALRYPRDLHAAPQDVRVPTLLVWGMEDAYLGPTLTENLDRWVPDLRVVRLDGVSHWVQHDVPERVNELLIEFFRS